MATEGWGLSTWSGSAWVNADYLDYPWDVTYSDDQLFIVKKGYNAKRIILDPTGGEADETLSLKWNYKELSFVTQLRGYKANKTILKLTDTNSQVFYCRVKKVNTQEVFEGILMKYNVAVEFMIVNNPY